MSDTSIWTFDQFFNFQLSCHVLILYAQPISDNTVESQHDRLKINEPVNAGTLCYCLTAHFVKYSISGKQTLDPWTSSFTSPWCVCVCVCVCVYVCVCLLRCFVLIGIVSTGLSGGMLHRCRLANTLFSLFSQLLRKLSGSVLLRNLI